MVAAKGDVCVISTRRILFFLGYACTEDALCASQIPPFRRKRVSAATARIFQIATFKNKLYFKANKRLADSHSSGNEVAFRLVLLETVGSKSDPDTRCPA